MATELGERTGQDPGAAGQAGPRRSRRLAVRGEIALALELAALSAFTFSRPVLGSFGDSPETFVARGAGRWTVVLFGLMVTVVPALGVAAVGAASRVFGAEVRRWMHVVLVAVLAGLAVWRLGQEVFEWGPAARRLIVGGVVVGAVAGLLRARVAVLGRFLRYGGVASLVFLGQFLFLSPTSDDLVLARGTEFDDEVGRQVAAQLGHDPPDVAMVVFDALPTASLLDGNGHIDAEQFPNFARLAGTSTWYRNHTTVAASTSRAVPAILTGFYPVPRSAPPESLFTLLGDAYDLQVEEQVTQLCPPELCSASTLPELGALLGDAVSLWRDGPAGPADDEIPGVLGPERFADAEQWIAALQMEPDEPRLYFAHLLLPHIPWSFLEDGTPYRAVSRFGTGRFGDRWAETGLDVGEQRQLLQTQAADRLLGQLLRRLEAAGTFDDTLVVVTADHGEAFLPGENARSFTEGNLSQVAWVPLLVKEPGQTEAVVDDGNVKTIDIVPTIADLLGFDLPQEADGIPAAAVGQERGDEKLVAGGDFVLLEGDDEGLIEIDAETARAGFADVVAANPIPATGPDAVWRRTEHGDLFGRDVAALDVGPDAGETVAIDRLSDVQQHDPDEPPLLEVVGRTELPEETTVAVALNGTVAALTQVEPPLSDSRNTAVALLHPDPLLERDNDLTAYVVDGQPGEATLHPLTLEPD